MKHFELKCKKKIKVVVLFGLNIVEQNSGGRKKIAQKNK